MSIIGQIRMSIAAYRTARLARKETERARQDAFMHSVSFEEAVAERYRIETSATQKTFDVLRPTPVGFSYGTGPASILDFTGHPSDDEPVEGDDTMEDLRELYKRHPEKF